MISIEKENSTLENDLNLLLLQQPNQRLLSSTQVAMTFTLDPRQPFAVLALVQMQLTSATCGLKMVLGYKEKCPVSTTYHKSMQVTMATTHVKLLPLALPFLTLVKTFISILEVRYISTNLCFGSIFLKILVLDFLPLHFQERRYYFQ